MDLSEIIKKVKQPQLNDELIKMFINSRDSNDFYTYIQQQNQLQNMSGIDKQAEDELHKYILNIVVIVPKEQINLLFIVI